MYVLYVIENADATPPQQNLLCSSLDKETDTIFSLALAQKTEDKVQECFALVVPDEDGSDNSSDDA